MKRPCATSVGQAEQLASDGTISAADLDEVRRFGAFLRASHGVDDEAEKARIYLEHYPEHAPQQHDDTEETP